MVWAYLYKLGGLLGLSAALIWHHLNLDVVPIGALQNCAPQKKCLEEKWRSQMHYSKTSHFIQQKNMLIFLVSTNQPQKKKKKNVLDFPTISHTLELLTPTFSPCQFPNTPGISWNKHPRHMEAARLSLTQAGGRFSHLWHNLPICFFWGGPTWKFWSDVNFTSIFRLTVYIPPKKKRSKTP